MPYNILLKEHFIKQLETQLFASPYVGRVGVQKIKYRPIRTQEIGGARLQEELYVNLKNK